jgi:HEAT repeat protein/TolA-binding protein
MTMKLINATLLFAAASLGAQEPPRPAKPAQAPAPAAAPTPAAPAAVTVLPGYNGYAITSPGAAPVPVTVYSPAPGQWSIVAPPSAPIAETIVSVPSIPGVAPSAPAAIVTTESMPIYHEFQGQGRTMTLRELQELQRERAREQAERQRELTQQQSERQREIAQQQAERSRELVREQNERVRELTQQAQERAREQADRQREMAQQQAERVREMARDHNFSYNYDYSLNYTPRPMSVGFTLPERPPAAWAQNDPADSLWRAANDVMGRGDYRKAAGMFKDLQARFKYSAYAVDAMYWQAHALYRVGSNQDLQDALAVLESLKATYPQSRIRGNNADVGALQVRIAGVLSARGMGSSAVVRGVLDANKNICDREEVEIRSAALNALMQTDPAAAADYAIKALAKKDECSRELRRSAVYLLGNKRDGQHTKTLIDVAKNDPNADVRSSAIEYLGRTATDDALTALEDLLKNSDDTQIQRSAIRALANNPNPKARAGIKALIERNDVNVNQRIQALDALREEMATTEDVNWLQQLYPKVDNPQIRSRIISAMSRLGGSANEKFFTTLANNENESIEVRMSAIRTAGQTMDIAALKRLYDQTGQRQLRSEIVRQMGNRREPETIDILGDIAKTGTDPQVRSSAITALMNKKDERATKLVLQLIDRP